MTTLKRRLAALEKPRRYLTLGDLLDALNGEGKTLFVCLRGIKPGEAVDVE